MAYDHAEKVGNEGDVIKHAVLCLLVSDLLSRWTPRKRFHYVETHAARAEYTLNKARSPGWDRGVGRLLRASGDRPEALRPYWSALGGISEVERYPGSSELAARLILGAAIPFRLTLHDLDEAVCRDLSAHFYGLPNVYIRQEEGLSGVASQHDTSLVLIDPPDLSCGARIVSVAELLAERGLSFMIWTPRSAGHFRSGWREGEPSISFHRATSRFCRLRCRWADWTGQGMKGCQITVSQDVSNVAAAAAAAVRHVMGWCED
jgi:hypothetical protein